MNGVAELRKLAGRFLSGTEVQQRTNSVVLGYTPYRLLFADRGLDPLGKTVRTSLSRPRAANDVSDRD